MEPRRPSRFRSRVRRMHRSKTVWFAVIISVMSVLQGVVFDLPISPVEQAVVGCVLAAGIVVLRYFTTGALDDN